MANIQSAKKRVRQIEQRTKLNKSRRSRVRSFIRSVEEAIVKGSKEEASGALRSLQPEIMKGVNRGLFHLNTASRKISRLAQRIKALG